MLLKIKNLARIFGANLSGNSLFCPTRHAVYITSEDSGNDMSNPEPKGSFVRWQAVTVAQLTYAINLLLTFAVATLGYQVTLLAGDKFALVSWQKCIFSLSLVFLGLSVLFGLAVVVNRLRAFRATMRAARAREKGDLEALAMHRALYKKLDPRTWWLFWWQVGAFAGGIVLTLLSVLSTSGHKLL